MTRFAIGVVALVALFLAPHPAAAQWDRGSFTGQATGHIGVASGNDDRGSTLSLGGSVAVIEETGWGAEVDFGFADDDNGRTGGLDVQSYMLNAIGMWPKGRLRPYVTAGGGALRARTCVEACSGTQGWTDWGLSAGGGVQFALHEMFALRGDVRYFTTLADHPDPSRPDGFSYWRFAIGATYLWRFYD
jgi:opacity protein-like surface antigen